MLWNHNGDINTAIQTDKKLNLPMKWTTIQHWVSPFQRNAPSGIFIFLQIGRWDAVFESYSFHIVIINPFDYMDYCPHQFCGFAYIEVTHSGHWNCGNDDASSSVCSWSLNGLWWFCTEGFTLIISFPFDCIVSTNNHKLYLIITGFLDWTAQNWKCWKLSHGYFRRNGVLLNCFYFCRQS